MSILTTSGLGRHFGDQDVFSGVNVQIAHGEKIGLVGRNGTGKTTLLRILAGLELPSIGQVHTANGLNIGYMPQETTLSNSSRTLWEESEAALADIRQQAARLKHLEEAMAVTQDPEERARLLDRYGKAQETFDTAGGYNYEYRVRQVLGGLGFTEQDFRRPLAQLSGGQQTRAKLARLLLDEPDLLLLDEPTNHLDLKAIEWLEGFLQAWTGAVVIVAHDRYFLDQIIFRVWEMDNTRVDTYRGNYSAYVQQRADRRERQRREYLRQRAFIAKEEEFIRRNLAGQRTKEAQGRRKRLERLDLSESVTAEKDIHLNLSTDLRSGDLVLATYDLVVGYDSEEPLFSCPDIEIRRGNRIALLGPNGAGKTTFVKTILKEIRPLSGRVRIGAGVEVGYFAQAHATLNLSNTALEELLSIKNLPVGEARNYLGQFLFSGDDVFKPIADLSGGERARVALAKLSLRGANFLVLDEPTNHLDIPSQEILQAVLAEFPGTILLVSHDRYFVDALATHVWALEKGNLYVTKGGYAVFRNARQARRQAESERADQATNQRQKRKQLTASEKTGQRGQYRRQKAMEELEQAIESAEDRLSKLAIELEEASRSQLVERVRELGQDYRAVEDELAYLLDQWAKIGEAA